MDGRIIGMECGTGRKEVYLWEGILLTDWDRPTVGVCVEALGFLYHRHLLPALNVFELIYFSMNEVLLTPQRKGDKKLPIYQPPSIVKHHVLESVSGLIGQPLHIPTAWRHCGDIMRDLHRGILGL